MTEPTLPPPMVPAEVDLRGLEYMPLLGGRLFSSDFNASATDAEWRAAVTLWWASWGQVPAGSLPADDVVLCRLADLGRDIKAWRKVKAKALHGFVPCSDGRLYHPVICEQALIAWDKRVKERDRKAKWRADQEAKRAGQRQGQTADVPRDSGGTGRGQGQGQDGPVPADGNRRDGTGRDEEERTEVFTGRSAGDPGEVVEGFEPTAAGALCRQLAIAGIGRMNPGHPRLAALIEAGATPAEFMAFADKAKGMDDPFAYLLGCVEGERKRAKRNGAEMHRGRLPSKQEAIEQRNRAVADEWLAQQGGT